MAETEESKRLDDQMDRLTRVLYDMCGEKHATPGCLQSVVVNLLVGVYFCRAQGMTADDCVRAGREASAKART